MHINQATGVCNQYTVVPVADLGLLGGLQQMEIGVKSRWGVTICLLHLCT